MCALREIIENIIKSEAGIIPVFIYDEMRIFQSAIYNSDKNIDIAILESNSKIAMQNYLYNFDKDKYCAIYSIFNIDVDGLIATNRLKKLIISPEMLLKFNDETKDKLKGDFDLTNKQYKLFIDNFDIVLEDIKNNTVITEEILKNSLAKAFIGKSHTPKDIFISFIKGSFRIEDAKELYLYEEIASNIKDSYNIDILEIEDNKDLFEKALITLVLKENKDDFGVEFNDKVIKINEESLNKIFNFIKENSICFENEIKHINDKFKDKSLNKITYIIPVLFQNYIADNITNYKDISIDNSQLWTNEMHIIGNFIEKLSYLDMLLKQYVSYSFYTNTMERVIKEYKDKLWEIDSLFREVFTLYEELSYNFKFYVKTDKSRIIENLRDMYFNVIGNINSKYINNYNYLLEDKSDILRQDEVFKKVKFRKNTVFIFADGLRYELAKTFLNDIKCEEIIDYDVFSLIPTETEICMNGYFITDERIRINNKNNFELIKDGKLVTQIIKWRIEKLSDILRSPIILFEDFKSNADYGGSVICFYDDVDVTLHSYNSAKKVTSSIEELRNIINYSLKRDFDVMLLSDHGFIDIESKIETQDSELDTEKKKGRYLILPANEKAETMYYKDDVQVADFVETNDKNICFINSINSLRKTSKYTHGGISLQENIITAILFKAEKKIDIALEEDRLLNLEAFNEIRGEISNAKGLECSIYAGTKQIFMTIIDTEDYKLRVPIRNYKKDEEFLITITGEDFIEKHTVRKLSSTVIDKDLDIF